MNAVFNEHWIDELINLFILQLRETQTKYEELETSHNHLQRRLDKLKTAKSALLKDI